MRLDKYLKVSRLVKRRTVANELAEKGHITVNDRVAKPGTQLAVGDVIQIRIGADLTTVRVKALQEHVPKAEAVNLYEILLGEDVEA